MRYSSNDEAIFQTTVTCHECGSVQEVHCIEWPPEIFVCVNCDAVYGFMKMSRKTGEVTWDLIVPEWEDD